MRNMQKYITVILCVCIVMVSILTFMSIASHADHECFGVHCEICFEIANLQNKLKHFCTVLFSSAFVLSTVYVLTPFGEAGRMNRTGSLISLKIRLNN